jgi:hypothetical protein
MREDVNPSLAVMNITFDKRSIGDLQINHRAAKGLNYQKALVLILAIVSDEL